MHYETDRRFVIIYGDTADRVADEVGITVLDRVDRVVLAETRYWTAVQVGNMSDVIIRCYDREEDARRVFGLFRR
jgi:hypothetical protein